MQFFADLPLICWRCDNNQKTVKSWHRHHAACVVHDLQLTFERHFLPASNDSVLPNDAWWVGLRKFLLKPVLQQHGKCIRRFRVCFKVWLKSQLHCLQSDVVWSKPSGLQDWQQHKWDKVIRWIHDVHERNRCAIALKSIKRTKVWSLFLISSWSWWIQQLHISIQVQSISSQISISRGSCWYLPGPERFAPNWISKHSCTGKPHKVHVSSAKERVSVCWVDLGYGLQEWNPLIQNTERFYSFICEPAWHKTC